MEVVIRAETTNVREKDHLNMVSVTEDKYSMCRGILRGEKPVRFKCFPKQV